MNSPVDNSRIRMQGVHLELSPDRQRAILNKFAAILRHEPDIVRLSVRLYGDQLPLHRFRFRAVVDAERRHDEVLVDAQGDEAYETLDELSDTLFDVITRSPTRHPYEVEHAIPLSTT